MQKKGQITVELLIFLGITLMILTILIVNFVRTFDQESFAVHGCSLGLELECEDQITHKDGIEIKLTNNKEDNIRKITISPKIEGENCLDGDGTKEIDLRLEGRDSGDYIFIECDNSEAQEILKRETGKTVTTVIDIETTYETGDSELVKKSTGFSTSRVTSSERKSTVEPRCGDGNVDVNEICDEGSDNEFACAIHEDGSASRICHATTCRWIVCGTQGFCGDGSINRMEEECDRGENNGDSTHLFPDSCTPGVDCFFCSHHCKKITKNKCGDGNVDPGEECDSGSGGKSADMCKTSDKCCTSTCKCNYEHDNYDSSCSTRSNHCLAPL